MNEWEACFEAASSGGYRAGGWSHSRRRAASSHRRGAATKTDDKGAVTDCHGRFATVETMLSAAWPMQF